MGFVFDMGFRLRIDSTINPSITPLFSTFNLRSHTLGIGVVSTLTFGFNGFQPRFIVTS